MARSVGSGWAGRRATAVEGSVGRWRPTAARPPVRVGERLRHRLTGSTVDSTKRSGWSEMGASPHLRWVAIAATALWLAAAAPVAVAQSPSGPDAAPSSGSSSGPSPDPAPAKSAKPAPKRVVTPAATTTGTTTTRTPVQTTPVQTTPAPAAPAASAPSTASRPTHRSPKRHRDRAKPAHRAPAKTTPHRVAARAPSLPRLDPARLVAPTTDSDAGRARTLAAGALSLLILTLASAMLLAFTARAERRRVVR
jgi:hypothetical protein